MADRSTDGPPPFESPVTDIPVSIIDSAIGRSAGDRPLTLRDRSVMTKLLVRAGSDSATAQQLAVPFGASRAEGEVLICGQRPEEWMLLGSAASVGGFARSLTTSGHVSVIDLTHGRALFRLTGRSAPLLLEKICSLDWDDDMTPDGAVVSASVAKTTCDIVRNDAGDQRSYLIACDRSLGQFLFGAIVDAGQEFGLAFAT